MNSHNTISSINKDALFCDETSEYRSPMEPGYGETITLRFRTAKDNVSQVYVVYSNTELKMEKSFSTDRFDFYEAKIKVEDEQFSYFFEVSNSIEVYYYNKLGCTTDIRSCYSFRVMPGFKTPDWAKGAVFYQIFVDRFCNGDKSNDTLDHEYAYIGGHCSRVTDWERYPQNFDVRCFYGGDLQGVEQKLDYLKSLGVEVIYFNPMFVSPSNHKYDIQDYDYIDPHFAIIKNDKGELLPEGVIDNFKASRYISRVTSLENLEASNEYFAKLVEKIHQKGMKVILDGVFNHCGSFNKWLDRELIYKGENDYALGAYVSKDSPYHTFFKFKSDNWPNNRDYDGWWGHDTLPKLNYEDSPMLCEYILDIAKKWVSPPYNVDGWRLDVAADLGHSNEYNHKFWRMFRNVVKSANPDCLILAEHYGDPSSWLEGDQWDTVMNYDAFMEPVTWFLTGMEKHSDEYNAGLYGNADWFFSTMAHNMSKMQAQSLYVAMNELSNHDHSRFLTRTNGRVARISTAGPEAAGCGVHKGVLKEAVMIQMTWPGAPTIYYGDEAGVVGWTDPDSRRTYPWGKEDLELIEFHRYIIGLHHRIKALKSGSYKPLLAQYQLIAYGRFCKENQCVIVVNNSHDVRHLVIPVWQIGIKNGDNVLSRLMATSEDSYNVGIAKYDVVNGNLEINIEPVCACLFVAGAWEGSPDYSM